MHETPLSLTTFHPERGREWCLSNAFPAVLCLKGESAGRLDSLQLLRAGQAFPLPSLTLCGPPSALCLAVGLGTAQDASWIYSPQAALATRREEELAVYPHH